MGWLAVVIAVAVSIVAAVIVLALSGSFSPARASPLCGAPPWPPAAKPIVVLEPGDIRALAEVIYGEARGEGWCGQIAVGSVVVNRLKKDPKRWGATVAQVVNKPNQFSSFGKTDPNLKRMKRADESEHAFFMANLAAIAVLSGAADPTGGAVYFHHRNMTPNWAPGTTVTAIIGAHVYRKPK